MHAVHVLAHDGPKRLEETPNATLRLRMPPAVPVHRVERVLHHPEQITEVRRGLPRLGVDGLDITLCSCKPRPDCRKRHLCRMGLAGDHRRTLRGQEVGQLVA